MHTIEEDIQDLEMERLDRKKKQRIQIWSWLSLSSIMITLVIFLLKNPLLTVQNTTTYVDTAFVNKIDRLSKSNDNIVKQINFLLPFTDSLKKLSSDDMQLNKLAVELNTLKTQIENLNKVILDNPDKAVSLPLLSMKIDNQKEQSLNDLKATKDEIARVYDMNKWIIGLVFGLIVSIVILNVSNLISKKKP